MSHKCPVLDKLKASDTRTPLKLSSLTAQRLWCNILPMENNPLNDGKFDNTRPSRIPFHTGHTSKNYTPNLIHIPPRFARYKGKADYPFIALDLSLLP